MFRIFRVFRSFQSFRPFRHIILGTIALYIAPGAADAQVTPRIAAGNTPAAIASTIADFKNDIGATDNGTGPAKTSGHRRITWDDVSDASAAPAEIDRRLQDVARGIMFEGFDVFQISMDDNTGNDPDPDQVRFDNLHPGISAQFQAFSEQRLFTTFGTPRFGANFTVPGSSNGATVKGFGVVFVGVQMANVTSIEFFDRNFNSLGVYYALPGKFSFVGVSTSTPYDIASVFIRHGNINIFGSENSERDIVVMDDIIFGEPQPPAFEFDAQSLTTVRAEKPTSTFDLVIKRVGARGQQATVEIDYEGTATFGANADFFYDKVVTFQSGEVEKRATVDKKASTIAYSL